MTAFKLRIGLGGEAMETPEHVADALRDLADLLDGFATFSDGSIRDLNGNTVGRYELDDEGDTPDYEIETLRDEIDAPRRYSNPELGTF